MVLKIYNLILILFIIYDRFLIDQSV